MRSYLQSTWTKVGIGLLAIGAGPLLFIILAAAVGLWPDPNPNPIGPGLLFFFEFWPAAICIVVGVLRVRRQDRNAS
jgi:hypothetical protein